MSLDWTEEPGNHSWKFGSGPSFHLPELSPMDSSKVPLWEICKQMALPQGILTFFLTWSLFFWKHSWVLIQFSKIGQPWFVQTSEAMLPLVPILTGTRENTSSHCYVHRLIFRCGAALSERSVLSLRCFSVPLVASTCFNLSGTTMGPSRKIFFQLAVWIKGV